MVERGVFASNLSELQRMNVMGHKSKQLKILWKKHLFNFKAKMWRRCKDG